MTDLETHDAPPDKARLYRQLRWTTLSLSLLMIVIAVIGIAIWDDEALPGWILVIAAVGTVPFVALLHVLQRKRIAVHNGRQPTSEQKVLSRKMLFWVGLGAAFQLARLGIQFWARATDIEQAQILDVASSVVFLIVTIVALIRIIQIARALRKMARTQN